jgi:hypothetical protein
MSLHGAKRTSSRTDDVSEKRTLKKSQKRFVEIEDKQSAQLKKCTTVDDLSPVFCLPLIPITTVSIVA